MHQHSTDTATFPTDKSNLKEFQLFLSRIEYFLHPITVNCVKKYFSHSITSIANDILGDVFIKFASEYESIDVSKRNLPYLITCIGNKTVDYYRASQRKKTKNSDIIYISKDDNFFSRHVISDSLFAYLNETDVDALLDNIHEFAATTRYANLYEQFFIQRLSVNEIANSRLTKAGNKTKPQQIYKELERLTNKILDKFKQ